MGLLDKFVHHKKDENEISSAENKQAALKASKDEPSSENQKEIKNILDQANKDQSQDLEKKTEKIVWRSPESKESSKDKTSSSTDTRVSKGQKSPAEESSKQEAQSETHKESSNADIRRPNLKKQVVKTRTPNTTESVAGSATGLSESETKEANKTSAPETKREQKPASQAKPIIVSFRHGDKKVANDYVFAGQMGQQLQLSKLPKIPGFKIYKVENSKPDQDLKITAKTQRITLSMVPEKVSYTLVPVNEQLQELPGQSSKAMQGQAGRPIPVSEFPTISGYKAVTSRSYYVPEDTENVKIVYEAEEQTIKVSYQDINGNILGEETLHGLTGEHYVIRPEERQFGGFELAELPANLSGVFMPNSVTSLVLKYMPVKSNLKVLFLDESGNTIHKPLDYEGRYNAPYRIDLPTIDGYDLESDPSILKGKYEVNEKTVTLRFKRSHARIAIHFWFDDQKTISAGDDTVVEGLINDTYEYDVPELDGYTAQPTKLVGRFNRFENPELNVVYHQIESSVCLVFQDQAGRTISDNKLIKKGFWGERYSFDLPDIEGYEKPSDQFEGEFQDREVTKVIYYTADNVSMKINYLDDQTGAEIKHYPSETLTGLVGTAYNVDPKMIDGYQLQQLPQNASGIFSVRGGHDINFMYHPNPSRLVLHQMDVTQNVLHEPVIKEGFYGQEYSIEPNTLAGYRFVNASDELKGTFPVSQKDINLYYQPDTVSFVFSPIDQYGQEIDAQFNVKVSGLLGQPFSTAMPSIPGYTTDTAEVSGTITAELQGKTLQVNYTPEQETVIFHFICQGGVNDGTNPFGDYKLTGLMGDPFTYDAPMVNGYEPNQKTVKGTFSDDEQYITITYNVKTEHYGIQFVDEQRHLVGGVPEGDGFYGQAIDISDYIPKGFHLTASSDGNVVLTGDGHYLVSVAPDKIMVNLIAQTQNGDKLGTQKQVSGTYHHEQAFPVPMIQGYEPLEDKITVKFEIGVTELPVFYKPEVKKITVRFMNTQGEQLAMPQEYTGNYCDKYQVSAPKFNGYEVLGESVKQGVYGLENIETAFIYRATSDKLNSFENADKGQTSKTPVRSEHTPTVQEPSQPRRPQVSSNPDIQAVAEGILRVKEKPSNDDQKSAEAQNNGQKNVLNNFIHRKPNTTNNQ